MLNAALRQRFDNILGVDRAFAQNLPGAVFFEKHDRRWNRPRRLPPVHDQRDAALQLLLHLLGGRAFHSAAQVGGGRGNRNFRRPHHRQRNFGRRHAQRYVPRIRSDLQRQMRSGRHNHGQRPRPETPRQKLEIVGQGAREFFRLVHVLDQQRERLVPQTRFDLIDSLHRAQVERVRGQTVKSIGRHAQHVPRLNLLGGVLDQRSFRRYGMNFQDFRAHSGSFLIFGLDVVGLNNEMYHTSCSWNQLMKQDAKAARTRSQTDRLRPVAGRHNQRLKELRLAFRRAELTPQGECALEGVKLIEEALRSGQHLETVFFSESARPLAEKLLPQINARTETLVLPSTLFNSIVPSDAPQGVAALLKLPAFSAVQMLELLSDGPFVVAAGLQDPGNLGTILRSAEAFGAAGVFLTEGTVSPYNSKVLRGSAGSIFRLPFLRISSAELIPLLRTRGVRLLATSSHQGTPLPQISWTLPLAIFIGNEGAGLSRELTRQMDETVAIPQAAQVESLNAGVAASILLYEAARNRKDSSQLSVPASQSMRRTASLRTEN